MRALGDKASARRVAIAAGPAAPLHEDGLEAYRKVWRRAPISS